MSDVCVLTANLIKESVAVQTVFSCLPKVIKCSAGIHPCHRRLRDSLFSLSFFT